MDQERWKVVSGYPKYEVSDLGRVRRGGKTLKTSPGKQGYPLVSFDGRGNWKVHRVVLETFVGPCPPGKECLHRNGIKTDNRLKNLRWGTRKENMRDAVLHGTHVGLSNRGEGNPNAKLSDSDVAEIRRLKGKISAKEISLRFGVQRDTIYSIHSGKRR